MNYSINNENYSTNYKRNKRWTNIFYNVNEQRNGSEQNIRFWLRIKRRMSYRCKINNKT